MIFLSNKVGLNNIIHLFDFKTATIGKYCVPSERKMSAAFKHCECGHQMLLEKEQFQIEVTQFLLSLFVKAEWKGILKHFK